MVFSSKINSTQKHRTTKNSSWLTLASAGMRFSEGWRRNRVRTRRYLLLQDEVELWFDLVPQDWTCKREWSHESSILNNKMKLLSLCKDDSTTDPVNPISKNAFHSEVFTCNCGVGQLMSEAKTPGAKLFDSRREIPFGSHGECFDFAESSFDCRWTTAWMSFQSFPPHLVDWSTTRG